MREDPGAELGTGQEVGFCGKAGTAAYSPVGRCIPWLDRVFPGLRARVGHGGIKFQQILMILGLNPSLPDAMSFRPFPDFSAAR